MENKAKLDNESYKTIGRLLDYLKDYHISMGLVVILTIIATGFNIVGPLIMGNTTNYVVESIQNKGSFSFRIFLNFIFFLIAIYLIAGFIDFIRGRVLARVNANVIYYMREDLSQKMKRLPISFFDQYQAGDLLSRMTNDIQTIADTMNQLTNQFIRSITTVLGMAGIMFYINYKLSLITFLVIPIIIFSTSRIAKVSQRHFRKQWKDLGDLNGFIEEIYSSGKLVKAYNYQDKLIEDFEDKNENLKESGMKAGFLSGIMMPISFLINNLGIATITVYGALLVLQGSLNLGSLQAFIQYSRRFVGPISDMADLMSIIQGGIAAADRVFEVLDSEEEIPSPEKLESLEDRKPSVKLDHVSFSYDKDKPILKDLNLEVEAGETLAIVGPTGSGKTTLVNLLMRFYELDRGSISIDNIDIRDVARKDLRSYIGMVLQDTWLFEGSIEDNIKYGNENASREEIISAAKSANCHDFIMRLDKGYDTIMEDNGSNLSEGQKQLITIARAIVANPEILILDEATSSVDTKTERLIQEALDQLIEGRTSFIIAHRLSTITNADTIIVLDQGRIVEKGSHLELLAENGLYREIYNSQF